MFTFVMTNLDFSNPLSCLVYKPCAYTSDLKF